MFVVKCKSRFNGNGRAELKAGSHGSENTKSNATLPDFIRLLITTRDIRIVEELIYQVLRLVLNNLQMFFY